MNQLLEIRQNIYYKKDNSEGEYQKIHEIVLVVDEPKYTRTNEGDVIRERGCKELRFAITADMFENVIEVLQKYKDTKEENLR